MGNFSARETEWLLELDGIELAPFWRRALAFGFDSFLVAVTLLLLGGLMGGIAWAVLRYLVGIADPHVHIGVGEGEHAAGHVVREILLPVLYFGLLTWKGRGQTPGKRLLKIRVVSLVHRHLTLWHSIERALGYGAAALEGGFGFFQFFLHPYRRCVQDRIAETIVVTESGYKAMQLKREHPLLPDNGFSPSQDLRMRPYRANQRFHSPESKAQVFCRASILSRMSPASSHICCNFGLIASGTSGS